jgi:uncharacterized SAM-binding protein YcdF (DUF218 family)
VHNRAPRQFTTRRQVTVNDLFATLGLLDWKPLLTELLLPPVALLALMLPAWWWRARRPVLSRTTMALAVVGLWFSQCQVTADLLERSLVTTPALTAPVIADLRRHWPTQRSAVLVLGGGVQPLAPEYDEAHLAPRAMARLHYGLWLSRQMQTPVMYSGGAGRAQPQGPREAEVAARIAARDYGRPLRWVEPDSRDTRENARLSVQLLQREGITDVLLVTHGWHMRRAQRNFELAATRAGMALRIVPAPMGLASDEWQPSAMRWLPSTAGNQRVRDALHEWLGWLAGA